MKTRLLILSILVLCVTGPVLGQLPEAPQPTLSAAGPCPAVARFDFDVSSIPNADGVRWQLQRAAPGQSLGSAPQDDSGTEQGTSGSIERDLRAFGPVLDGTRYSFRVRARQGDNDVSAFSSRVIFDPDLSPDGMFTVSLGPGPASLRIDWTLAGEIGACADRIVARIQKVGGAASQVSGGGASGSLNHDVSASGPGEYDVRLHARFGGDAADDAVGRESAPVRIAVAAPPVAVITPREESATAVPITITSFQLQGGAATVQTATPITLDVAFSGATPSQYKAAVCGADFAAATFLALPTVPLGGFPTAGTRAICFQARNAFLTSAVAQDSIQVVAPPLSVRFPAPTGPPTSVTGPGPVILSSFQIRNGAQFVTVNRSVPLNVTATGSPTEIHFVSSTTSACETALAGQPFQAFSATAPPTISFASAGRRFVCVQVRRSGVSSTSTVVKDDIDVVQPLGGSELMGNDESGIDRVTRCDGNRFAIGIYVRWGLLIDSIALQCADLTDTGDHRNISPSLFVGGKGGDESKIITCPTSQVLFGLYGKSRDFIDRIGVLCVPWNSEAGSNGTFDFGDTAGGPGLGTEDFGPVNCSRPLAVYGLSVYVRFHLLLGLEIVEGIHLHCKTPPNM